MLAGLVVSAVTGGLAGLAFALGNDHGVVGALLAYQIGGMMSAISFVAMSYPPQLRKS